MKKLMINKASMVFLVVNQTPVRFTASKLKTWVIAHTVFTLRDSTHRQTE